MASHIWSDVSQSASR